MLNYNELINLLSNHIMIPKPTLFKVRCDMPLPVAIIRDHTDAYGKFSSPYTRILNLGLRQELKYKTDENHMRYQI